MIFIATQNKLEFEIQNSFDCSITVQPISGEYLPIAANFINPNVYFVSTTDGCGCNFSTHFNINSSNKSFELTPAQKLLNQFRKLTGSYESWVQRHESKELESIENQKSFLDQTYQLLDLILNETKQGRAVEMYCVWANDYSATPELNTIINTSETNLKEDFYIEEREFVTYK